MWTIKDLWHWVAKGKELENQSLWQSSVILLYSYFWINEIKTRVTDLTLTPLSIVCSDICSVKNSKIVNIND